MGLGISVIATSGFLLLGCHEIEVRDRSQGTGMNNGELLNTLCETGATNFQLAVDTNYTVV